MATFAVDSRRQAMVATGIVEPVTKWGEDRDGKRFRTDEQAVDEPTGMPLWGVEVIYRDENYGRESSVTAVVEVPSSAMPSPGFMTPIVFKVLVGQARFVKTRNALVTMWRAEGVESMTSAQGVVSGAAPGSSEAGSTAKSAAPAASGRPEGGK